MTDMRGGERWVWLALGAVVAAIIAVGVWRLRGGGAGSSPPPVVAALPPFALVERSGRPLRNDDLRGTPWVADFVFTRCTGMCPALSTRMAELQRRLRASGLEGRSVSFTVDPTHDTPEVLREYARRFAADEQGWLFVTGDHAALYDLIGKGFRLSVAERSPSEAADGGELITHSDRFVLVDATGAIRGYYHGSDADVVDQVLADLAALQGRPAPATPLP